MGLNFARIAELDALSKAAPSTVVTTATAKTSTLAALSSLESLSITKALTPAQPEKVESAGTINFHQVSASIRNLDAAIKAAHPQMPKLLQEIWGTLKQYPECVTLLDDAEVEIVVSGLEKLVDTDLAAITLKGATGGAGKANKKNLSLSLLGF